MSDIYLDVHGASSHNVVIEEEKKPRQTGLYPDGSPAYSKNAPRVGYNESNPGLGLRYEWGEPNELRKFVMGGQYKNSVNNLTNYLGGGLKYRLLGNDNLYLDAGGVVGGMTGYGDGITPALMPMLSVGSGRVGLNMLYAPEYGSNPETYMLSGSYKLK